MTNTAVGDDRTIVIERVIDAPRSVVWKAFTDPEQLPLWWGPEGYSCETSEIDIREGGVWRFTMCGPNGVEYKNRITFNKITPEAQIAYTTDDDGTSDQPAFDSVARFEARGNKTVFTLRMRFDSAAIRKSMEDFGAVEGGHSTIDCLENHLQTLLEKQESA